MGSLKPPFSTANFACPVKLFSKSLICIVAYILYKNTTRLLLVEKLWGIEYIKWFPAKSNTHLKGTISVLVKSIMEGNRARVCDSV
jgi:hypothetical protein